MAKDKQPSNTKEELVRLKQLAEEQRIWDQRHSEEALSAKNAKDAAAQAERYQEKGTAARGKGRMDLWDLVKEDAQSMIDSSAEAYQVWTASMVKIMSSFYKLAKALDYSASEITRATIGKGAEVIFDKVHDKIKIKIARAKAESNLPPLEYEFSFKEGQKIKTEIQAGQGLTSDTLERFFYNDLVTWLEEKHHYTYKNGIGYTLDGPDKDPKPLDKNTFEQLKNDEVKGFNRWLEEHNKGLDFLEVAVPKKQQDPAARSSSSEGPRSSVNNDDSNDNDNDNTVPGGPGSSFPG